MALINCAKEEREKRDCYSETGERKVEGERKLCSVDLMQDGGRGVGMGCPRT